MKKILVLCVVIFLSGCASGPPAPELQTNAKGSLDRAVNAYLSGDDRVAAEEFARTRSEMASSGQVALVVRAELIRCAAQLASLVLNECSGFEALRQDAAAPERAYADYLAGRLQVQDIALLPAQHQSVMRATAETSVSVLAGISDPLARLVGAGVLLRAERASPAALALAVDTASMRGWRRPLLTWLGVQVVRAEKGGDAAEAQRLQRRMDLILEAGK
ncbi:hypothetical protein BH11PSE11_BH11PSE11_28640 [soil metagenome]